jgi:signal transduction histidine kinase
MALVQVIDTGPGIEAADLDRVMARFAQARDSSKSAGFGIGLSLARWIIEEQGGHITLQSPVPEPLRAGLSPGTLVTVFLPRAEG